MNSGLISNTKYLEKIDRSFVNKRTEKVNEVLVDIKT